MSQHFTFVELFHILYIKIKKIKGEILRVQQFNNAFGKRTLKRCGIWPSQATIDSWNPHVFKFYVNSCLGKHLLPRIRGTLGCFSHLLMPLEQRPLSGKQGKGQISYHITVISMTGIVVKLRVDVRIPVSATLWVSTSEPDGHADTVSSVIGYCWGSVFV